MSGYMFNTLYATETFAYAGLGDQVRVRLPFNSFFILYCLDITSFIRYLFKYQI